MLLNWWTARDDPSAQLPDSAHATWQRLLALARREALAGRLDIARDRLDELRRFLLALEDSPAARELALAVELELHRCPRGGGGLPRLAPLQRFRQRLLQEEGGPALLRCILLAVTEGEVELLQVLRRQSADPEKQLSAVPRTLALIRLRAVSELGLRHPAVGVLNLHLATATYYLRDYQAALEHAVEAHACFDQPPRNEQFAHERSEVLLRWAELAVDLGDLHQAEDLLLRVWRMKALDFDRDARTRPGQVRSTEGPPTAPPGIPLCAGGERVTDRPGLARCHGLLGKIQHYQGRLAEALESFAEDARLSQKARDQVYVANRRGQILLEAGAHAMALHVFQENLRRQEEAATPTIHRPLTYLGLARTELVRSIPLAVSDRSAGPRQKLLRQEARRAAQRYLEAARRDLERLRGPGRAWVAELADSVSGLLDAHACLDAGDLAGFEKARRVLLDEARALQARSAFLESADLLGDLMRLELWAWRGHGHAPAGAEAETCGLLLDQWERIGACERVTQLQEWAEEMGHGDVSRLLLSRYLPQVVRGQEAQATRAMTVWFADVRDYSGHCRRLRDPERIVAWEAALFRTINPVVQAHRGTILRYQGDSMLAVFNVEGDDPDHAGNAVRCGLEVQQAVRRFNRLRRASESDTGHVLLPIGIHTGPVALTHLMIPGRREVTVFGKAVNLAKRLQESSREYGEELIVSGDTLARVEAGRFREFPLGRRGFKGHEEKEDWLEVFALRPPIPCRVSFVGLGTALRPQRGLLAMDVGNRAEAGVIDHHQPGVHQCAAELLLENPAWARWPLGEDGTPDDLEVVVHAQPDLGCCAAVWMALDILEGRPGDTATSGGVYPSRPDRRDNPGGSPGESDLEEVAAARQEARQALAAYVRAIDAGRIDLDEEDPASSPYALLAAVGEALRQEEKGRAPSEVEMDRLFLQRGVQLLHAAVLRCEQDPRQAFARIFQGHVPRTFAAEVAIVRRDLQSYRENDRPRLRRACYLIPCKAGPEARVPQDCAIIQDPHSVLFKLWARGEGYPMLVVDYPQSPLAPAGSQAVRIPLSRFIISVLPDSGLTLAALAAALDRQETVRRRTLTEATGVNLVRHGPPRPGYDNADPWYDGRSILHANTIVDAPRQGSVLHLDEVVEVLQKVYPGG
jgi:class 3 adenylate cyclase